MQSLIPSPRGARRVVLFLVVSSLLGACGADGDGSDRDAAAGGPAASTAVDSGPPAESSGDPAALRFGVAGWENTCAILSIEEVAGATGFTVLETREVGGCYWMIETVDENIGEDAESSIGWVPLRSRDFDIQKESAMLMSSDATVEPVEGLGTQAFWQGDMRTGLGALYVQTDQIGFTVINQFASGEYEGDFRQPMGALAAALADSLAVTDVIAASGEAGKALVPPENVDLPEGISTMDGLIDELASVPFPDGAVFGLGDVYPDRASQDIYVDLSVGDAARFFLEALPTAGFEIVPGGTLETEDQVLEFVAQSIAFLDPDERRGDIQIREGAFAPTELGIQIFISR